MSALENNNTLYLTYCCLKRIAVPLDLIKYLSISLVISAYTLLLLIMFLFRQQLQNMELLTFLFISLPFPTFKEGNSTGSFVHLGNRNVYIKSIAIKSDLCAMN